MPTVLTYNLTGERATRIHMICLRLKLRVRAVSPEEYALPVGALAGMLPPHPTEHSGVFADEMLVFVNFDGAMLNRFLGEIRAARIPGVALKAVLTPTNMYWSSVQLYDEIQKEHEAMQSHRPAHSSRIWLYTTSAARQAARAFRLF